MIHSMGGIILEINYLSSSSEPAYSKSIQIGLCKHCQDLIIFKHRQCYAYTTARNARKFFESLEEAGMLMENLCELFSGQCSVRDKIAEMSSFLRYIGGRFKKKRIFIRPDNYMKSIYIVTPCLNMAETIDRTIASIVEQQGDFCLHYHIQDGGSSDGTLDKIVTWEKLIADGSFGMTRCFFSYASARDGSMYDAINKGFASFDIPDDAYMAWLNADDIFWPGALEAITRVASTFPFIDWITGWDVNIDMGDNVTDVSRDASYPQHAIASGLCDGIHLGFIQQESTFWRKRLWDAAGGIDATLKLVGDWDLWRRFARYAPLTRLPRRLGAFRQRDSQLSTNLNAYYAEMDRLVAKKKRRHDLAVAVASGASPLSPYYSVIEKEGQFQLEIAESATFMHRQTLADLNAIVSALGAYHDDHGKYPVSVGFDGLYTAWGESGPDWIKGLAPAYIKQLPRDPRHVEFPEIQYLYCSDGKNYKLLAHNGPGKKFMADFYPEVADPVRNGYAYGYWTRPC